MDNLLLNTLIRNMESARLRALANQPNSIRRYYAADFNVLTMADGYKYSQFLQIPEDTSYISSYIESRAGGVFDKLFWVDFQPLLIEFLSRRLTRDMVEYMRVFCNNYGVLFNYNGFMDIVEKLDGYWPLHIRALPEGLVVDPGVVLVDIEPTIDEYSFAASWMETMTLRSAWYGSTVGTISYRIRKLLETALDETSDLVPGSMEYNVVLAYMLNDFGARGASSPEAARLGGLAHLLSGFRGTDNTEAVHAAIKYYHEGAGTAGNTACASEHSTASLQGKSGEVDFNNLMIKRFGHLPFFATVIDSFDPIENVRNNWCGTNKQAVLEMNARLVLRPDSGYPPEMALAIIEELGKAYGFTVNSKGYKVLDSKVRVIYGDGIDEEMIDKIYQALKAAGWSIENICFGMGGALLQKCDRDWMRFAQKTNETEFGGIRHEVQKLPTSDPTKASKLGRHTTLFDTETNRIFSIPQKNIGQDQYKDCIEILVSVFKDGIVIRDYSMVEIRELALVQ